MGRSLNTLGAAYWIKGDHETALKYYFQALEYCKSERMKEWESTILGNIGIIYTDRKEYDRALQYLHRALSMKSALKDSIGLVRTMNNIGKTVYRNADG
jgi:tetratricopeptide (TPR) repeat protein